MPALTSVHLTPYCGQMKPSWFAASLGPNSVFGFPGVKGQEKVPPPDVKVQRAFLPPPLPGRGENPGVWTPSSYRLPLQRREGARASGWVQ